MLNSRNFIMALTLVLCTGILHAQPEDSTLAAIIGKLAAFTSKVPREEIFIHTDKEEYIAGEDLWFNAFLIDRKSLTVSSSGNIVYLELINSENKPVVQKRVLLKNGTGPGHLILPDTLNTGIYSLRAYTNLMKNFLPYNCFIKNIVIFNTLRKEKKHVARNISNSLTVPSNVSSILRINNSRPDSVVVFIDTGNSYRSGNGVINYLIVQSRGNPEYSERLLIREDSVHKKISREHLAGGINQVVLFNSKGVPVAERFFYIPMTKGITPETSVGEKYNLRDKITIGFEPDDAAFKNARLSISVSPVTEAGNSPDIDDYLVFGSEFNTEKGFISGNICKNLSQQESDSVLARLGSNWIRWDDIISGKFPEIQYQPEKEYHFVHGSIPGGNGDTVLMCSPSARSSFQYTRADTEGNFIFRLHIDEDPKDLLFMPHRSSPGIRPVIYSSFSDKYFPLTGRDSVEIAPAHFARAGVDYQVRRLFNSNASGNVMPPLYTPERPARIYGIPDLEIRLADYIELPTMNEVFIELIPGVSLRNRRPGYEILMSERVNDKRLDLDPTLMIDGVIIKDAALIADLDPSLVNRIDVISRKYLIGDYMFNGIVNVITKTSDFSSTPLPEYMTRIKYNISDQVAKFNSPEYTFNSTKNSRVPDYRNTLFWSPVLTTSRSVEFWSSDNKMKYMISIQGITGDGKPFSLRKTFLVE